MLSHVFRRINHVRGHVILLGVSLYDLAYGICMCKFVYHIQRTPLFYIYRPICNNLSC